MNCKDCGICCIVCSCYGLTQDEILSGIYKTMRRMHENSDANFKLGWSDYSLRQKLMYIPEFKKSIYVCIYYDPVKRQCTIYEKRPWACRSFDCDNHPSFKNWRTKKQQMVKNKDYYGDEIRKVLQGILISP